MTLNIRSQFCHGEVNGARRQILLELHIIGNPETSIETWESCKEEVIKIIVTVWVNFKEMKKIQESSFMKIFVKQQWN